MRPLRLVGFMAVAATFAIVSCGPAPAPTRATSPKQVKSEPAVGQGRPRVRTQAAVSRLPAARRVQPVAKAPAPVRSAPATPVAASAAAAPRIDAKALQHRLSSLGYWLGEPDGQLGGLTRQAIFAFQKTRGLPRDGKVSPELIEALKAVSAPEPRSRTGDLVEIDKGRQLMFVVRDGRVLWTFNVSTGTDKPYEDEDRRKQTAHTPEGRWIFERQLHGLREADLGDIWSPKYFAPGGVALHGSESVPAHPSSHGCVRISIPAINYIWEKGLAPLGSTIWVY
ncbi:MAG TPA: L,D-transpeptidase family protein [Actinomycetota bacterium]|nr:L,D-transpeptidase family protein [Actinomycetota bacterium]